MVPPLAVPTHHSAGFILDEEYSYCRQEDDCFQIDGVAISYSKPPELSDYCFDQWEMELEDCENHEEREAHVVLKTEQEEEKATKLRRISSPSNFLQSNHLYVYDQTLQPPTKARDTPVSVLDSPDTPPLDLHDYEHLMSSCNQVGWNIKGSSPRVTPGAGFVMVGDHELNFLQDHFIEDINYMESYSTIYSRYDSSSPPPPPSPFKLHSLSGSWKDDEMACVDEGPISSPDDETGSSPNTSFSGPEDHQSSDKKDYEMISAEMEAEKQKKPVFPPMVAFRRCIKDHLDKQWVEESAMSGCRNEGDTDEEGFCNPENHSHHPDYHLQRDPMLAWAQERESRNYGLQLVQHLFACAEAVACRDARQARSLLQQVRELASPYGDSLQRVATCFVEGLAARLQHMTVTPVTATPVRAPTADYPPKQVAANEMQRQEAFHFMCEVCPYVPFGHFIANSIILDAFEGEQAVHVIDLGMAEGLQWPALIHGLAARPGGPPKLLRITGVGPCKDRMVEIGEALRCKALAAALNFEFQAVEQPLESVVANALGLRSGEVVAVNSVLQLHCVVKESRGSLNRVLQAIHALSPKVLTLVEQDANHNGPFFLGRFMEALYYYSAIFDSLQVALPRYSTRRIKIEQFHLALEIRNIVACEGSTRVERHERVDQWRRRMSRAGFQPAPVRLTAEARLWLARFNVVDGDNYTLSDEKGCLVLGWKGKPIIAASAWRC